MPTFGYRNRDRVASKRNRCQLQERDQTAVDDRGHPVDSWVTVRYVRAEFMFLSGRDSEQARQLVPDATHRIVLGWQPEGDDLIDMRLVRDNGAIYYVGAVEDQNYTRRQLRLLASQQMER